MKYLIYLRVSTEEQDVRTQLAMCIDRMDKIHPKKDYSYEVFTDDGVSSRLKLEKRPALCAMLAKVEKGVTVMVYKLDRLSRDILEMIGMYRNFIDKGAKIISLNDPHDDEFTVGLMGLLAQKERDTISVRTRDKLANKRKNAERYSRHLPYGYEMHPTKMVPVKDGNRTVVKLGALVPISKEQEALLWMGKLSAEGMSYQQIADNLTNQGYMNREGKPFHKMSIYRILNRTKQTTLEGLPQLETTALEPH